MATAILLPILAAAAPLLQPLISSLIVHVESLFGAKTGATKFDNVLTPVLKIAGDLSTAGKIPGQLDPSSIAMMIETLVQDFKSKGVLTPEAVAPLLQAPATAIPSATNIKIIGGSLQLGGEVR